MGEPVLVPVACLPDTKSFRGDFGVNLRLRLQTFEEAEAAAARLLSIFPEQVIAIERQVGRVKLQPAYPANEVPE